MTTPAPDDLIVPAARIIRRGEDLAVVDLSAYEFQPMCDMCDFASPDRRGDCGRPAVAAIRFRHCNIRSCQEQGRACESHWHFSCRSGPESEQGVIQQFVRCQRKWRVSCTQCREVLTSPYDFYLGSRAL